MEEKGARVLLEQGERKPIPAPFFMRLFGKKTIDLTIYMPSADTCLRAVRLRLRMDIPDDEFDNMTIEEALRTMDRYGVDVARVVAIVILRSSLMNVLFGKWLSKKLLKVMSFKELSNIMELVTIGGGLEDFISSIEFMKTMRLMRPRNSSQQVQGS